MNCVAAHSFYQFGSKEELFTKTPNTFCKKYKFQNSVGIQKIK